MRASRVLSTGLGLALLVASATAAIKPLDLSQLMSITTDVLDAQIVSKETFRVDDPAYAGVVFTKARVVGESMRTGEAVDLEIVFRGSHDPADDYGTSEMPALQDMRLGNRVVLFYESKPEHVAGRNVVWNWASTFRVETVFGEPVLLGKGEGAAFEENLPLVQAREQVRMVHAALEAEKASKSVEK